MPEEHPAKYCRECKRPLTEVDNRGELLKGCMTCNIWWSRDGAKVRLQWVVAGTCNHRELTLPPVEI